ncbi:hypothetical protein V1L54_11380 [Streptomyces sp. TRM 70361]|uniref:hypothetical protein n=1 Tax=Streptomyces sp. TRM 70361 TaxID=3116553 RepID=UPI002E7BA2F9|nr:hypothetical protein [Streptomyces sp. TRM 70361]MEE1939994.1 hypothetical protein [Streptomyces sp. TRM 70361]
MRLRTALLVLGLPLGRGSQRRRRALVTALRAADSGDPAAVRAVAGALKSLGPETVWRTWTEPPAAGPARRHWTSPLVTLMDGPAPVPDVLVDAGWRDWLDEHQPGLWSLLRRWNRPATAGEPRVHALSRLVLGDGGAAGAQLLADTAARFDHPAGEYARAILLNGDDAQAVDLFCAAAVDSGSPDAIALCTAHHLAPHDEVERAVFFVRTGQREQHRALDPDGTLLSLGYRGALPAVRSALREAMTRLGGIDALRVLAGRRSWHEEAASLSRQELTYLVERFKEQADWDRLWQLTLLLPLAEAVSLVRALGTWRPSGEDDRRVFEELRAAVPAVVGRQVKALCAASSELSMPRVHIRLRDLDGRVHGLSGLDFAPDGGQLAFACLGRCAGIVDVHSGTLSRLYSGLPAAATHIAHLGAAVIIGEQGSDAHEVPARPRIRYAEPHGRRRPVPGVPRSTRIRSVERITGDRSFAVLSSRMRIGYVTWTLSTGKANSPLVNTGLLNGMSCWSPATTTAPGGRLIAVFDRHATLVADLTRSAVNVLSNDGFPTEEDRLCAAMSPSVLLLGSPEGRVRIWHEPLTCKDAPVQRSLWPGGTNSRTYARKLIDLAWSPALQRFVAVVLEKTEDTVYECLKVLDVPESRDNPPPDALVSHSVVLGTTRHGAGSSPVTRLSPDGDVLAVADRGPATVSLYALSALGLRSAVEGPMGRLDHGDLANIGSVLENPALDGETRAVLVLLRTCLEHRYRYDIGIGTAEAFPHMDDDIELGR